MKNFVLLILSIVALAHAHFGFDSPVSTTPLVGTARSSCTQNGANGACGNQVPCQNMAVPQTIVGPTIPVGSTADPFIFNMRQSVAHEPTANPAYTWTIFNTTGGTVNPTPIDTVTMTTVAPTGPFLSPEINLPSQPGQYLISALYDGNLGSDYYGCLDFIIAAAIQAPSNFAYNPNTLVLEVNQQGSAMAVINDGGEAVTFTSAPLTGATLDSGTGTITILSATPVSQTDVTVTATNSEGSVQATFTYTVSNQVIAPTISYPTTEFVLVTNDLFPTLTPTLGGDPVQMDGISINPPLPGGIMIDSNTGVISGVASAVVESTMYTITATNAGGSNTATITITVADPSSSASDLPPILGENCVLFDFPVDADGVQRRAALSWTVEDQDTVFFQVIKPSVASGYLGLGINPTVGGCVQGCMGQSEFVIFQDNNLVQNDVSTFTRVGIDGNPGVPPQLDPQRAGIISDVQMSSENNVFSMSFRRSNTGAQVSTFIDTVQTFLVAFREGDLVTQITDDVALDSYHGGNGRVRMDIILSNPTQANNCNELGFVEDSSASTLIFSSLFIVALLVIF